MIKNIFTMCVMTIVLFGCQNAGYMMDTYNKVGKQQISTDAGPFWVFDRPDLGKIMTSPSPGSMAGPAFISGATLGAVKLDPVLNAHQAAANQYLSSTGRKCTLRTSFEIWRPNYEHTYTCK